VVYNRTLDGEVLTIAASGWTWHQIFVLQDYETGSLWFPGLSFPGGRSFLLCVAGPNQGRILEAVIGWHRVFWKNWYGVYPSTLVMLTK
jgi:hypothetical protein